MSPGRSLDLPHGSETCQLAILNTTCDIVVPPPYLVEPEVDGYEWMNLPTYSFHIKHKKSGRELLFDLGCRKDWENSVPNIANLIGGHVNGLKVEKDVIDILAEHNVDINSIEAFVLSHWHFDHCGAPSALPKSMKLIVGPKFKESFLPGFPSNKESPFHEADFNGRDVVEPPFSDDFKLGRFQAHDYFGDGSFYVLNVPGHAVGHISGLVRTTPDTFVFLGGDVCHYGGVMRPSQYIPMPDEIPEEAVLDKVIARPCPCSAFLSSHPNKSNPKETPFFKVSTGPASFYVDPATAQQSVHALIEFDADPNVLVAIAHDPTSLEVFDFFPNGYMNDWRSKGWKRASHWGFLSELPYNGKQIRPLLVDGSYQGEKKLRGLKLDGE